MPGFLSPHHFELIATHWQGLSMGCLFPALPRSSLPAKKLEGLLRYIEGCGSETLLKTIFCLYSLSSTTPDNSRPLFQFLCELFWACLFLLVIWVKPRMTQLDDPHLRPSQTLLLGLERAKEKLPLQSTQDEVPAQPWVFFFSGPFPRSLDPQDVTDAQGYPVPQPYLIKSLITSSAL